MNKQQLKQNIMKKITVQRQILKQIVPKWMQRGNSYSGDIQFVPQSNREWYKRIKIGIGSYDKRVALNQVMRSTMTASFTPQ